MSLTIERDGPVTTVILSRPEVRNAVDPATARDLADTFRAFDADSDARACVLYGDHGHFCAGFDLKALAASSDPPDLPEHDGPMGPTWLALQKPVVAAIAGYAVAGGLELALWCDLRVMEEDAVLGVFCRRWGVPLVDGGTVRLPRIIGLGRALDLILTGRPVAADEALAIGLVSRVVPHGRARHAAEELAHDLARFPQTCLRHDRHSTYDQHDLALPAALANERRHGLAAFAAESAAGARQFAAGAGRHGVFETDRDNTLERHQE